MTIDEKFQPFQNYFSGSASIRPIYKEYVATPTYCHVTQGLFRSKKAKDIYVDNLYKVMTTRTVSSQFVKFENNTVSAHWVTSHLNENLQGLNELPSKIQIHTQQMASFAENNGVDIQDNLKNINTILNDYNNDPKILKIKDYLKEKLTVVDEWEKAVVESTKTLIGSAKKMNPELRNIDSYEYDNNIDSNQDLAVMKKFIDERSAIFENNRTGKEPDWFDHSVLETYINKLNTEATDAFMKIRNAGVELRLADKFMVEHQSPTEFGNITEFLKEK